MSKPPAGPGPDLKAKILEILQANRTMAVATVRPDGWPQATIVGYVHDDLTLYFAIARTSQKLANILQEPRISVAIGAHHTEGGDIRGLSMAAFASEITAPAEVARLNALIADRYPEQAVFAPRGAVVAVMKAVPEVVSLVAPGDGVDQPVLLQVGHEATLKPYVPSRDSSAAHAQSWIHG